MPVQRSGVTVDYIPPNGLAGLAITQRYGMIIGTAPATKTATNEPIVRGTAGGTDAAANTITAVTRIGNSRGTSDYIEGQDFQLTAGEIDWSLSGDEPTPPTVGTVVADSGNTGTGSLTGVTAAADAINELYTVTFTSTTVFNVTNRAGTVMGSGNTSTVFTTSDGYITIPSAGWLGTPAASDVFSIPVGVGQTYFVTYTYARPAADYAKVWEFRDFDSAVAELGAISATNLLPLGIRLYFKQGAPVCRVAISQSDSAAHISTALTWAATKSELADIAIVAGPAIPDQKHALLRSHCIAQSSKDIGKYRIGWLGFPANTTIGSVDDLTSVIGKMNALKQRRLVGISNTWATENVTALELTVDGSLIACAVMGLKDAQTNPSEPLLKKQIIGFSDIEDVSTYVTDLLGVGGTIIRNRAGVMIIDEITTLDTDDANDAEIGVVSTGDYVANYVKDQLDDFIGRAIDDPVLFPQLIVGKIESVLLSLMDAQIIARTAITSDMITAKISTTEPRQILFSYEFYPRYVLKWLTGEYTYLLPKAVS